ncbi:MAG: hypothetical protein AAF480_15715 [Actinomycetota bacterium]
METDEQIDPGKLADGAGVPHGKLLVEFVNATVSGGDDLAARRDEVTAAMGLAGLVDAAAVVANFTMMTRIADGTGTPLDEGSVDMSAGVRAELGVDDFTSKRFVG